VEQRTIAPEAVEITTALTPERRSRSIYQAIVYAAAVDGRARFTLPPDLARSGIDPARLDLSRAELRFGVSDPRGLGANPRVTARSGPLRLEPGGGTGATGGAGFFAALDASELINSPIEIRFAFDLARQPVAVARAPGGGHQVDRPLPMAAPVLRRRLPADRAHGPRGRFRCDLPGGQSGAGPHPGV
jgi:inner membrane protein